MRAVVCRTYGEPDVLEIAELDPPEAGPGAVVVDVVAAAVNFPDLLVVADRYQVSVPTPFVPGSEFAGTVASVGPGVEGVAVGDRVCGSMFHGAFAEKVRVAAEGLTPVPDGVDLREAAAFYVTHTTAYHALRSVAGLTAGERLLVLGAAGGVGSATVALGRELGAVVVAAASGGTKLAACRAMGASLTVDAGRPDFREALREVVPDGVDVVIDPVGGRYSEPAVRATRWGARFVTVGYAAGEIPAIPLNLVLLKGVTLTGLELRGFGEHRPADLARDRRELDALFESGRVRPLIAGSFTLDDTAAALRLLADREAIGKVLVVP